MSRKGTKTVNLPESLLAQLQSASTGLFESSPSRDELVRHAVTILLIGLEDVAAGRRPLARMQAAIKAVPGLRQPPRIPPARKANIS